MATIEWLEGYLTDLSVPLVVISHDRTFLDRVCNQIVETERGISRSYLGNYSQHLEQKVLEREASQSAFERQQKELAAQQAYIDRFRASATRSTQAKSREKLLDKVERIDAPVDSVQGPQFQFPPAPRSGRQIALIDKLTHHYDDNILFLEANLEVERGDRIAFVGPNGAGKSTLLHLLQGAPYLLLHVALPLQLLPPLLGPKSGQFLLQQRGGVQRSRQAQRRRESPPGTGADVADPLQPAGAR